MKILPLILSIVFFSCGGNKNSDSDKINLSVESINSDTYPKKINKISIVKSEKEKEGVVIYSDEYDTTVFSKEELEIFLKYNPELNKDIISSPDISYAKRGSNSLTYPDSIRNMFESEVGEDEYFELYAYYLKNRNGIGKYNAQRKRLIKIYLSINDIFGMLDYGGTYYAHQHMRIVAYAEYSIHKQIDHEDYYVKQYDYSKQKEIYVQSLRQLVKDEASIDNMTLGEKNKTERLNEILESITDLNALISDYFDLKCAEEFQYSNY
jgi:hypothetical protein